VKSSPGGLKASGTAIGGAWHLALAGWLETLGLSNDAIKWIPTAGAEPSLQELSSGGIELVCCSLPEADRMYRNNQVRCLGVMSEERATGYEEIPTFKELGYDWTLVGWRGFAVPNGTPPERVKVLAEAMRRVASGETKVDGKTFPQFMAQRKFNNRFRERDEFVAFLKENDAKFHAPRNVIGLGGRPADQDV
jgi:tripartite-type tricarboxylate transporter receptor subunit TctC